MRLPLTAEKIIYDPPNRRFNDESDVHLLDMFYKEHLTSEKTLHNFVDNASIPYIVHDLYAHARYPLHKTQVKRNRTAHREYARPIKAFSLGQCEAIDLAALTELQLQGMLNNMKPCGKSGLDRYQVQGLVYLLGLRYDDDSTRIFTDRLLCAWLKLDVKYLTYIKRTRIRPRKTTLFDLTADIERMGLVERNKPMTGARLTWQTDLVMRINELNLQASTLRK